MKKQWNKPTLVVLDVKNTFKGPPNGGPDHPGCKNSGNKPPWCS